MRTLLLLRGTQGSGKSTFIKENKLEPYTISPDTIRLMFQNPIRDIEGNLYISQENNKEVWELVYKILEHRMERGDFTVIDATHASPSSVKKYKEMAEKYRYSIYYYQFDVELEECIKRNKERENYKYVTEDVIRNTYNNIKSSDLGNIKRIYSLNEIDNFYIDSITDKYDKIKVIGDIHGCHTALKEIIQEYNEKDNTLWVFLGDYLDRGIENKQVLSTMMYLSKQRNVVLLEGNHECLSKETEVLTQTGWKLVKDIDIDTDKVLQYNLSTQYLSFANPIDKIEKYSDKLIEITTQWGRQGVTPNHDVIYYGNKIKAKELLKYKELNARGLIYPTKYVHETPLKYTDDELRLAIQICMDSTVVDYSKYNKNSNKITIQFKLSKPRKINHLENLLNTLNIPYTKKICKKAKANKLQPYYIRIYGEYARYYYKTILKSKKIIPNEFKYANNSQANVILQEIGITDGYIRYDTIVWSSISKHNIDIITQMCIFNNILIKTIYQNNNGFKYNSKIYRCSINNKHNIGALYKEVSIEEQEYKDLTYCLTMPDGTLVTRYKGKINITGNCHVRNYAYDFKISSKEFLNRTLPQITEGLLTHQEKEFKKDIRMFYKRLRQAYAFEFNGNKYLCTHAGLTEVPKLTYISTEDLIKGVGDYVTPISEIYEENYKLGKCQDFIQIFGHRTNNSTEHSINLEGEVEFGGDLKYVEITKDGVVYKSVKNNIFDKEYLDKRVNGITQYKGIKLTDNREINKLIISKLTKVRLVEPNMYSINFTENTFKKKLWNDISIKARGLFVDRATGEVKIRAFDKFFNENERTETKLEMLKDTLKYPLKVEQKENGYLGIISVVNDEFVYATKTSTNNDNIYTQELKRIFNLINVEIRNKIYDICKVHNCSFVFEVISKSDPHIIEYQEDKLVLLTVVENSFETKYLNKLMDDDSLYDNILHKVKTETYINNSDELIEYIEINKKNREDIEGVVITDTDNFKFKVKFDYYNKWKYARDLVNKYVKNSTNIVDINNIKDIEVKDFITWVLKQDYDFIKNSNILKLRNLYKSLKD